MSTPSKSRTPVDDDRQAGGQGACTLPIDDDLAFEHPELVVLDLLHHTVVVAHRALGVLHPEIYARGDLGALPDRECHLALLLSDQLEALPPMLSEYRATVELIMANDGPLDDVEEP